MISLFVALLFTASEQPATVTEAEIFIEKVKAEISKEEELWAKEKQSSQESEIVRNDRYAAFFSEKQKLSESIEKVESDIEKELANVENLKRQEAEFESRFKSLQSLMLQAAQVYQSKVDNAFPAQIDKRKKSAGLLVRDLKSGSISVEEAFNRLWILYLNEEQLAQEAEVFSGTHPKGGATDVKFLRIGKQILLFASKDGQDVGYLAPNGNNWEWVYQDKMTLEDREAIRKSVSIAEGTQPPQFAQVPIPKTLFSNQSGSETKPVTQEK